MEETINTLLSGGVVVALITLGGQLLMWFLKGRNSDSPVDVPIENVSTTLFDNKIEIQQIIDRVINISSADRFLILKTENGGGKPRLGSHLYSSVMYESIKPPLNSVKNDYQRLLVDDIYVKMLSDIGPGAPNRLNIHQMKEGILKNIYRVENIEYSEVHYIGETDSAFLYLSIATSKKDNDFHEPLDRVEIEIAISKIRGIFKNITEGTYKK